MEIELKLTLPAADNARLLQHPLLAEHALGAPRQAQLLAHYFDTPDLHLYHHGAGLRVRQMDGTWIQTMKAGGSVQTGLHSRNEWEGAVTRAWPQLGKLRKLINGDADGQWHALLNARGLAQRLQPLFAVRVERTTWQLQVGDNAIEMVLDHGAVEHHTSTDPINEIELELKSGQPQALFDFALRLQQDLPLRVHNVSKAERGYALCGQSGTCAHKAQPVALRDGDTVEQALRAIIVNCLQHIQNNEAGVLHSDDDESVHQMRVGVRRLRSAFKLFESCVAPPADLLADIEWLGGALGGARDWDVLAHATLQRAAPALAASKRVMALEALTGAAVRQQRQQAVAAIASPRYTQLLLALGAWLSDGDRRAGPAMEETAAGFARAALRRGHRKLLKRGAHIADGDARALHRVRIAGKQARYALEFFQPLLRRRHTQPYLEALSAMQDELGRHNDLVVADRLLAQLEQDHPEHGASVALVRGYLLAQQESGQSAIRKMWKSFESLARPK